MSHYYAVLLFSRVLQPHAAVTRLARTVSSAIQERVSARADLEWVDSGVTDVNPITGDYPGLLTETAAVCVSILI